MDSELMYLIFGGSGIIMAVIAMIKEIVEKKFSNEAETEAEKMETLETLLQMGARTDLYQIYKMAQTRGSRTTAETEMFQELYETYKVKYNGNSYAEEIEKSFLALPQEDDE